MSSPVSRKRKSSASTSSRCSSRGAKTSVTAGYSSANIPAVPFNPPETIDILDTTRNSEEDVVDLTCECSEPSTVVDLTNNDSVVVVEDGSHSGRASTGESYVVSSDEEEDGNMVLNAAQLSSLHASSRARTTPGTISCPVCMDSYAEIIESGRLVVSTKCGHIFCSQCLRDSLPRYKACPTCRKKLNSKQYHPIYI